MSNNRSVGSVRTALAGALQGAHRVAEGALEVQLHPAFQRARHTGAEIADVGISALAHIACVEVWLDEKGPAARDASLASLGSAAECLEKLRAMLTVCESKGLLGRMDLAPIHHEIVETVTLVREAASRLGEGRSNAA